MWPFEHLFVLLRNFGHQLEGESLEKGRKTFKKGNETDDQDWLFDRDATTERHCLTENNCEIARSKTV